MEITKAEASGYNAAIESFRTIEYPMLDGMNIAGCHTRLSLAS